LTDEQKEELRIRFERARALKNSKNTI
jgi:hypothetical protein